MARITCASHLSTLTDTDEALAEACASVDARLDGAPTLAVVFCSPHHAAGFDRIPEQVRRRLGPVRLIGCTGESIVGRGRELEEEPALSLWAIHLPDATLHPFHVSFERVGEDLAIHGWPEPVSTPDVPPVVLMLPDPFTSDPRLLLQQFAEHYPGAPVIGGVASGGLRPGKNRLFLDEQAHDHGAVGVLIWGPTRIATLVSQGCQPIGKTFVVTRARENVIFELGGKPAFEQFQEVFLSLDERTQFLARSPHVGCVINEAQERFGRGDFLLRNLIGIDRATGAMMLNDSIRLGQTIQFHVRDADCATEDLDAILDRERDEQDGEVAGALMFTCNGRGTRMFEQPNHDAGRVGDRLGDIPLAGFFAQGEIGPVGGRNFLHGFTASLALFYRD